MFRISRCIAACLLLVGMGTAAKAADRAIVILDASGSMWAQIDGRPKLEIARKSLRTALQSVPADAEIGFMAYGHREKGSCQDIELIVPPQAGSASAIVQAADSMKFLGKTPLTDAVRSAAEALKYTEDKARVILITDGLETCGGDPCALGEELKAGGVDFTAHVVAGEQVSIEYGDYKGNLEPGDYVIRARLGEARTEQRVAIEAGKVAEPLFVLNAGTLIVHPRPSEGAEISEGATLEFEYPGGEATEYGDTSVILPAGEIRIKARIGKGSVSETVKLAAGETVEKDIIVGIGHVAVNAYYTEGGEKADNPGIGFEVVSAKKSLDGTRESVEHEYGPDSQFQLPAGDYVVVATLGFAKAEQPFTVKVGEAQNVDVTLNAGVLAVSAPGAESIEILEARKNIEGNRKSIGHSYDEDYQTVIPAGDYVVVTRRGDSDTPSETKVTVKAGERTEVSVP